MRAWLGALVIATCPALATAQGTAALVADAVFLEQEDVLVAEGDVQVSYEGSLLSATRITYDQSENALSIEGPLTLTDEDGTILLADSAELEDELREGILTSARLVLDRQLQLAATEIARVDDRFTQLSNTVASSCDVCSDGSRPLWEIRARRVIYDEVEEQLYFYRAQFRLMGVPVAYIPRLRLPAADNERSTGLLSPRLVFNSDLGFGARFPYFIVLGPYADLTLAPYVATGTRTLEARYRHNFTFGSVNIAGAFSDDDIIPDERRHYLFGEAAFTLPQDLLLEIEIQSASDNDYLDDYAYEAISVFRDRAKLSTASRQGMLRAEVVNYTPLRSEEVAIADQLPSVVADAYAERRMNVGPGQLSFGLDATAIQRDSDEGALGRDVAEIGTFAEYNTRRTFASGLVLSNRARVTAGVYKVEDDSAFDDVARSSAAVSTELRLPLQKTGTDGSYHLLEPVIGVAWSESDHAVPNEDSTLVDFDEGNLFSLSRFPGDDRIEQGLRANAGLGYTGRFEDAELGLAIGRVFRTEADEDFFAGSGLDGTTSDWLTSATLDWGPFGLGARALIDKGFDATKVEALADYNADRYGLSGTYLYLDAEPLENRPEGTHEFSVAGNTRVGRHWNLSVGGRYDIDTDGIDSATFGIGYQTECILIGLDASRRYYRNDEDKEPASSITFAVELLGFGSDRVDESYRTQCRG
ncbi:LPS-assembly protein LptD [Palleronia sp.]|uniref:LPS-assembly protein LptD n=1 Tax=Palleronia sp. TaxID=1940284 RepID=UPI0035C7C820